GHTAGGTAVGQRDWIGYRQLAHPVSCPPAIGELAVTASSGASQGRSRASTWTPRSREGTPTCTWQAQVPASATTGPYRRASSWYRRWPVTAASPGARYGATPDATRRQPRRAAAAAASRRSLTSSRPRSSRPVHTLVPVSTWNC